MGMPHFIIYIYFQFRKYHVEDIDIDGRTVLTCINEIRWECGLDSSDPGQGPVAGYLTW